MKHLFFNEKLRSYVLTGVNLLWARVGVRVTARVGSRVVLGFLLARCRHGFHLLVQEEPCLRRVVTPTASSDEHGQVRVLRVSVRSA